ncbi:hypothetical protein H2O64_03575 [Kordia sp. YSTF-M3]|uniref:Class I lanthipeptide n=1 Tax=Kordia aestuariivivens TaxID=2759037 RepID=A0ABR7Q590_9FLAO|nr:class I lanthipeptide [Kordia aestuariivivens]MBC8753734.1 hypothetical protein [Kordia aestuariivivens]
MKKKEFNSKLQLGKNVISNLQASAINGGTDIPLPVTTIIITIKTQYRLCTHIATCNCSMHCVTEDDACKTERDC